MGTLGAAIQTLQIYKKQFLIFPTLIYTYFHLFLGREVAGEVTLKHIYEIACVKKQDSALKNVPLESVCKIIIGSARSLGIKVVPKRTEP